MVEIALPEVFLRDKMESMATAQFKKERVHAAAIKAVKHWDVILEDLNLQKHELISYLGLRADSWRLAFLADTCDGDYVTLTEQEAFTLQSASQALHPSHPEQPHQELKE